jgi:hypothetical protein
VIFQSKTTSRNPDFFTAEHSEVHPGIGSHIELLEMFLTFTLIASSSQIFHNNY